MKESGEQNNLPGMITELPTMRRRGKGNKKAPVKIFSKLFGEEIYIVETREEMDILVSRGVREPIYLRSEIHDLLSKDRDSLKAVDALKRVFPGSAVVPK